MIRIYCEAAEAVLKETQTLTAGMVNYPEVLLTFSSDWDGYGKAVVVKAGEVEESALIVNNKFIVPAECFANSGVNLIVGISGSDGVHTIPTIWCSCGEIMDSADVNDSTMDYPATPSLVEQMLGYAGDISDYAEELDKNVIRTVNTNATGANTFGTANVTITDSGAGDNRTLTFVFTNLKGNGISNIIYTTTGEHKGHIQIKTNDGTDYDYDGLETALASVASTESDLEAAEALRVAAEALRVEAETARASAENDRADAETTRESNETSRQNFESVRQNNESVRITNEADREAGENTRQSNEASRQADETLRSTAETNRVSVESGRVSAEASRVSAETDRGTAETARATAESGRASAETLRVSAETSRATAENSRASAEAGRASAESTRVSNESGRVSAEEARAAEWETWGDIVEDAEAYARGTRDGVDVESTDPAYHNNALYYSTQAGTSANNAGTDALKSEGFAVGEQGGVVQQTGTYYHNNAKYYSNTASSYSNSSSTSALKSEGYAVGTQNGVAQNSGTYYHNNAKYYAEQAEEAKAQAMASETNAANSETNAGASATSASGSASSASSSASSASTNALLAEGYAVGTQNGQDVSSSSPYYHNNAEWYAGVAEQCASNNGYAAFYTDSDGYLFCVRSTTISDILSFSLTSDGELEVTVDVE